MDSNRDDIRRLLGYARAIEGAMRLAATTSPQDMWRFIGYRENMRKYNALVDEVAKYLPVDGLVDKYNLDRIPDFGDVVLAQQQQFFNGVFQNVCIIRSYLESQLGAVDDAAADLTRFIGGALRRALFSEPEAEVTVQNALEMLLVGRGLQKGEDYDRETGRVKISAKEVIPDFVLLKLGMAIEVKLANSPARAKAIIDEINADIRAYAVKYPRQLFVVYDSRGSIRDEQEFRSGLEDGPAVRVVIVKH